MHFEYIKYVSNIIFLQWIFKVIENVGMSTETLDDSEYDKDRLDIDFQNSCLNEERKLHLKSNSRSFFNYFFIDIIACLVPGIIFLFSLIIIFLLNFDISCFLENDKLSVINQIPLVQVIKDNQYTFMVLLIALSYTCGFALYRRDLDLPDSVSQFVKALKRRTFAPWIIPIIYFLIFVLFPFSAVIRAYNFYLYRQGSCCGFKSNKKGQRGIEAHDYVESTRLESHLDGIVDDDRSSKKISKFRLFLLIVKCLVNPFAIRTYEYHWRYCDGSSAHRKHHIPYHVKTEPYDCHIHSTKITRYPYEDFYHCYLNKRGLFYLKPYVYWDKWIDLAGKCNNFRTSKRFIENLKIRLNFFMPAKCGELTRVEAHIRLASSMWYLSRMLGVITIFCIILSLFYIYKEDTIFSKDSLQSQIEKIVKLKISTLKPFLEEMSQESFISSGQNSEVGGNEKNGLSKDKKPDEDQQKEGIADDKKDAIKETSEVNKEKIKSAAADILANSKSESNKEEKKKDLQDSLNKTVNDSLTSKLGEIYSGMSKTYALREFYNFKYLTLYFNVIILLLCIFFNYSSALFLHYLRLKEVAYVLEFVRIMDITFKDKASLKDFECYECADSAPIRHRKKTCK